MRHHSNKKPLDRKKAPRESLLKNLATQIILYEKVKTTQAKAKVVKSRVEKIITRSKVDNLSNRRIVMASLHIKSAARKAFEVLGPRYKERAGGYLRIIKLGHRQGDGADMVQIEFV